MTPSPGALRAIGVILALTTVAEIVWEWTGVESARLLGAVGAAIALLAISLTVSGARRVFVLIGLALAAAAVATRENAGAAILDALSSAAFIAAFFTALTALRAAASTSRAVAAAGRFLAGQPPGRRYAALSLGGQLFGLILGYAALTLLGSLAETGARADPDAARRARRLKRMLLAVQRGFVATLPWSPLAFAVAISTSLVPGARWADAVGPCLVSAALLLVIGWALDRRESAGRPPPPPLPGAEGRGGWTTLWPLAALLALLIVIDVAVQAVLDIRTIAVVMLAAPLLALGWSALQLAADRPAGAALRGAGAAGAGYVTRDLPGFRGEILLLAMAGFIGTLGATFAGATAAALALDVAAAPAWAILLALVWLIPLSGQLGMNPILFVSLIAPLLPAAEAIGIAPSAYIVAITAGWALSAATSPVTATTLMIGALGGVGARRVGLVWNGLFTLIGGAALSAWAVIYALA